MRTISEPARHSAATWRAVASTSAVSVLVIDWTTIGAPPPTVTAASPSPTLTPTAARRGEGPHGASEIADFIAAIPFSARDRPDFAARVLSSAGKFVIPRPGPAGPGWPRDEGSRYFRRNAI